MCDAFGMVCIWSLVRSVYSLFGTVSILMTEKFNGFVFTFRRCHIDYIFWRMWEKNIRFTDLVALWYCVSISNFSGGSPVAFPGQAQQCNRGTPQNRAHNEPCHCYSDLFDDHLSRHPDIRERQAQQCNRAPPRIEPTMSS